MDIRQATPTDSLVLSSLMPWMYRGLHAEHHPDIFKAPHSEDFAKSFFDEMLGELNNKDLHC